MKWTAWWSVLLTATLITSCGSESGKNTRAVSNDSSRKTTTTGAASDCRQLGRIFSELLALTNQARHSAGLGSVAFSYRLGQAAQGYAKDMGSQNFFSHTGKNGSVLSSRLSSVNYPFVAAGENLAAGQISVASVFQGWMNSPEHRANILRPDFTEVGFGFFDATGNSDYGTYWVQNFGQPQSGNSRTEAFIPSTCGNIIARAVQSTDQPTNAVVNQVNSLLQNQSPLGVLTRIPVELSQDLSLLNSATSRIRRGLTPGESAL